MLRERSKSRVSIRNILVLQKAVVGIAAVSAERGGYRSGTLYHRRPRKKPDKLSDETYETTEPRNPIPFSLFEQATRNKRQRILPQSITRQIPNTSLKGEERSQEESLKTQL